MPENSLKKTVPNNKRILFLDHARVIACVLVLLVHVSATWLERESVGSAGSFFALSGNILAFVGVSLYVMISGALVLSPEYKTDVKRCLYKSFRLMGLWVLWKVMYRLFDMWTFKSAGVAVNWKEDFFLELFRKPGHYHLWFLPMLAIIYLLVPLIKKGCEKRENCLLYLLVFVSVSIVLPTLFLFEFPFRYLLEDFYRIFDLSYFAGYLGYFILGYYFTAHDEKEKSTVFISIGWFFAIATFIIACVEGGRRSAADGVVCELFSTPFSIHNLLLSAAVFLTLKRFAGAGKKTSGFAVSLPKALSSATLGVYLIHPFILDIIAKNSFMSAVGSVWTGLPVMLVLLVILSFIAALLLRMIPVIKKIL
jgi:surface polysaccharide O-acyltransferase-like enzyme